MINKHVKLAVDRVSMDSKDKISDFENIFGYSNLKKRQPLCKEMIDDVGLVETQRLMVISK